MTQEAFFDKAKWMGAPKRTPESFAVLRGHFDGTDAASAQLQVLGLGFFKCYINGTCVNPDTFLPLSSEFEAGCDPVDEVLSGHRIYVPQFDITPLIHPGDNVIAIHYEVAGIPTIGGSLGCPRPSTASPLKGGRAFAVTAPTKIVGSAKALFRITCSCNTSIGIFG